MAKSSATAFPKLRQDHRLFAVVQLAYRLFACPKPLSTGVCNCCMNREVAADFFNPAISRLPAHYVREWYSASYEFHGVPHSTWRYMLPRILEMLAAEERLDAVGIETSFSRYETGNKHNWSSEQWFVLDEFQRLFLDQCIEGAAFRLDEVLCMFRLGGWALEELTTQVTQYSDVALAERLWQDWCADSAPAWGVILTTALWPDADRSAVFEFYRDRQMRARFEKLALSDDVPPRLAGIASNLVDAIDASFQLSN
jgi:hypothetical protein